MTEAQILTMAASLVASLFGLLAVIIGWMGSRVIDRLEQMVEKMNIIKDELNIRINGIDRRLVRIEAHLEKEL